MPIARFKVIPPLAFALVGAAALYFRSLPDAAEDLVGPGGATHSKVADHAPSALIIRPQQSNAVAPSPAGSDSSDPLSRYAALLDAVHPSRRQDLQRLLINRHADSRQWDNGAAAERELSLLLNADEYAVYELLRESAHEQDELRAFEREIAHQSPLTREQSHALLMAKLHRKYERDALRIQAADRPDQPDMERSYARDIALQGLDHDTEHFLDEAEKILSNEQWLALERFERASSAQSSAAAE